MSPRLAVLLLALGAVAVGGVAAWRSLPGDAATRAAIAAHCRGVEPEQAAYPQLGATLRARAWLIDAPSMPDGVDLFTALPDLAAGRERIITPSDLRETMRRVRGLAWDPEARAWSDGTRSVPLAEARSLLVAALPTASDADAILDLLLGTLAPGAPNFAAALTADPPALERIRLVPFHGDRGRLLLDRGRPPYAPVERGYNGLLAAFDGQGMPAGWRVLRLRSVAP